MQFSYEGLLPLDFFYNHIECGSVLRKPQTAHHYKFDKIKASPRRKRRNEFLIKTTQRKDSYLPLPPLLQSLSV